MHRAAHQKLLEAHNVVVVAYIDSTKRPCTEDSTQLPSSDSAVAKCALGTDSEEACPNRLLSSDYPRVSTGQRVNGSISGVARRILPSRDQRPALKEG
jgi:hypothetical protein